MGSSQSKDLPGQGIFPVEGSSRSRDLRERLDSLHRVCTREEEAIILNLCSNQWCRIDFISPGYGPFSMLPAIRGAKLHLPKTTCHKTDIITKLRWKLKQASPGHCQQRQDIRSNPDRITDFHRTDREFQANTNEEVTKFVATHYMLSGWLVLWLYIA